MSMKDNYVVIMAGGVGSRFWPFSRQDFPKQFHDVLGTGKSLLQQTVDRFTNLCPPENIYIVTNQAYKELVNEQLPFLADDQILLEPVGRNTAPCIAYAAYKIGHQNPNAKIIVSPADHIILKENVFEEKINIALDAVSKEDLLITLGIQPSRPDTGYGYIQFLESEGDLHKVKTFTEKPHLELAQKFLESGDFVWNAGIFVWTAASILKAFKEHLEDIAELFESGKDFYYTDKENAFIKDIYGQCKNISIDYGIMEKADNVFVVLSDIGWSDLGTWKSLYDVQDKDQDDNVLDGDIITYDTKNCIIKTPSDRLVVAEGLDGYIVAEHDNVLMICRKEEEQKVKEFVSDMKENRDKRYY